MVRCIRLGCAAVLSLCAWIAGVASAQAGDSESSKLSTITVPEGFTVELVAEPPLVEHPMMACFDPQGRLYVADSAGFNLSAEELLAKTPNRLLRLEDTDGDGRFDKRTVYADKMTFPMGAQWYRGALYVASPPSIWRLEDRDGDGVAEKRKELVSKFGFIGNAADIHGCFLGPDGRIYWCDGRHGYHFESSDGTVTSQGQAARIFSCLPDGSDVQVLCGGGMDNPVELAFAPEGDVFGTMTFYNPDDHRHDAIVHYIHGGVYPRKHAVVDEFKRTGGFMPPLCLFETVAPAGLMRYQGTQFPSPMHGNLFSVQFNTHKVMRHPIERDGATWRATSEDFLVSSHIDFHPTDVLEDADGSLLVIDTGGWFRHGCPTSEVAKPEVLGAIYRIRRKDAEPIADPRGLSLIWDGASVEELLPRLDDPRPVVAERAIDGLALRGDMAVRAMDRVYLFHRRNPQRMRNAIWALTRVGTRDAQNLIRQILLVDDDVSVRLTAARALGTLHPTAGLHDLMILLRSPEPELRREAATALGRLGSPGAVNDLFEAIAAGGDRFVEHAVLYALIEINHPQATRAGLRDDRPQVRRAALIALDQMDSGDLKRDEVVRFLSDPNLDLQSEALAVITRHEGWADETVGLLGSWLADPSRSEQKTDSLRGALAAFAGNTAVQELVANALHDDATRPAERSLLLECIARSSVEPWPDAWTPGVRRALADADAAICSAALATAARDPATYVDEIATAARNDERPDDVRVAALGLLAEVSPLTDADLSFLIGRYKLSDAVLERLAAAQAIGHGRWNDAQIERVAGLFAAASPLEFPALIAAFRSEGVAPSWSPSPQLGRALVEALSRSPGRATVPAAQLVELLARFDDPVVQKYATALVEEDRQNVARQAAVLAAIEPHLATGDAERGKALFAGRKAGCIACHRVGSEGDTVGPDLSKIGAIRAPRDLLESIVLPSVTLARGYETVTVITKAGQAFTGVITRETGEAIYLRTAQREEIRIARGDIEDVGPQQLSIMPQGLDQTLSPAELADLVAYLQSLH